jgi:hypothetical protein
MARKKQTTNTRKAHPPTAASKGAIQHLMVRRDMRRRDPFAITADVDPSAHRSDQDAYVTFTTADLYGGLVPAWQEDRHEQRL